MYNSYFGFKEAPFSIAPDPRYLFMTDQHREALAHLVYGLNSEGGCILLTGEVGTGKTTVCRCLLEQIPEKANIALVLNPRVTAIELLETICDELHIDQGVERGREAGSAKDYTDRINRFLLDANARGEKTVLIIDEAQNLDSSVLEQLRLLTNLETNQRKLLQIIILGQPELLDILARDEMRQLAQRITARYHLRPLKKEEMKGYLGHRLAVAGSHVQLFTDKTVLRLYRLSDGIPRIINTLCDRALLGAYVENKNQIDTATLEKAAREVFGERRSASRRGKRRFTPYATAAVVAGLAVAAALFYDLPQELRPAAATDSTPATGESVALAEPPDARPPTVAAPEAEAATDAEAGQETGSEAKAETEGKDAVAAETAAVSPAPPAATATASDSIEVTARGELASLFTSDRNARAQAYQDLFKLWQYDYKVSRHGSACQFAADNGLSCLHKQGNLRSLALLNRPAVLKLYQRDKISYAILTRLEEGEATLVRGDRELVVDTTTLNRHWLGEYTLLWQTPPYYNTVLQQGTEGPVVQWLDQQLVRIFGDRGVPDISNTYSDKMASQVRRFQLSKGLVPDGVAGPNTLIMLNSELELDAPKLTTGEG